MKILVAVDSSEASQALLKEVSLRRWPPNSSVEVVNVIEPTHMWTVSQTAKEAVQRSAHLVHAAVEELNVPGLEVHGLSLKGDPKRVILDRAQESQADLVFVGSQRHSELARFLLGSVASAIVRHAPCSVEIARVHESKSAGKPPGVRKILLATDGSKFSERAAQSIADRPWPEGTEVEVLSVVELTMGTTQALLEPPYIDSAQLEPLRADAMKRAQDALATAVEILSKTFPKVSESISVLLSGPKNVIIEEADETGADLIVVGSHGHRGIERFMLGSVSEAVALHANCSVEVIR